MKEKQDVEFKEEKKASSISRFATLSTLTEEEMEEENEGVDEAEEEASDYGYDENNDNEEVVEEYEEESPAEPEEEPRLEHTGTTIVLQSKPTEEDIFRFMFRHTYCSALGVIACLMAIGAAFLSVFSFTHQEIFQGVLFAVIFFVFAVYSPINLLKKARKQSAEMSSPEGIITYTFSDAGFDMERGDEYAPYAWSRIIKVINGKTGYYVYLEKNRAFIATKLDLASNEATFVDMLKRFVKNYKG